MIRESRIAVTGALPRTKYVSTLLLMSDGWGEW
jgi:hypothetical protein